jgi:hypothetical protein
LRVLLNISLFQRHRQHVFTKSCVKSRCPRGREGTSIGLQLIADIILQENEGKLGNFK